MDNKIIEIVEGLKKCYIQRDAENVDYLMDLLFKGSEDTIIIGTSNNEWCFTDKDKRELFLGDWKYWKNVLIDKNNCTVTDFGRYKLVEIKAGLENIFTDCEESFKKSLDYVKETIDNCSSSYAGACSIEWMLCQLLHSRSENSRKYILNLNIDLILEPLNDSYICRLIEFSLPLSLDTPDVRVDVPSRIKIFYDKETAEINEYIEHHNENADLSKKLVQILNQQIKSSYSKFQDINIDRLILKGNNNSFYFCGSGLLHKHLEIEEEMSKILDCVKNNEYSGDTKDILFKIRRDIAYVNKEFSLGQDPLVPFRCTGLASYDNGNFTIQSFKITLPNYGYQEQKNDEYRLI